MSDMTVKDFVNGIEMFREGLAESLKNKSMSDYIKREMAVDSIVLECDNVTLEQARQAIKDVPSADVVEVVRCKNCKKYMTIHCTCDGCCINDEWYCADGERKED